MYLLEFAGQEDAFAAFEATSAATDVTVIGAGLATARAVSQRVDRLAFTRRVSDLVAITAPDIASAAAALEAARVDREGTVAVRAVDVRATAGVDTQHAERVLGRALVEHGFAVDLEAPDHVLRACFAGPPVPDARWTVDDQRGRGRHESEAHESRRAGKRELAVASEADGSASGAVGGVEADGRGCCALGWLVAESDRAFASQTPTDRPFFQPGSMGPALARWLVNVAGAREGRTLLDPMCGTGGLLLEGGHVGARLVGADAQRSMVRGTRENLAAELDGGYEVCLADARRLPLRDGAVDAAVFDVPYGRQSKIAGGGLVDLVGDALTEVRRVADRAVVVGDRSWVAAAEAADWTVTRTFERRVHRSLVRHVHVLR